MKFDYYKYFHELTTDRTDGGRVQVPDDQALWPPDWRQVHYKTYNFFKELVLPPARGDFFERVSLRRSSSSTLLDKNNVSLDDLAYILKCGYGLRDGPDTTTGRLPSRTVPSAGARYPLELYILQCTEQQALPPGIYHYNVRTHALELVQSRTFTGSDQERMSPLPWFTKIHGLICISAVFNRTVGKYGTRGYRYVLLEAGHVGQNMLLAAADRDVVLVPVGGVEDGVLEQYIGLDDSRERLVYCLSY